MRKISLLLTFIAVGFLVNSIVQWAKDPKQVAARQAYALEKETVLKSMLAGKSVDLRDFERHFQGGGHLLDRHQLGTTLEKIGYTNETQRLEIMELFYPYNMRITLKKTNAEPRQTAKAD